jgi:hypothetical protein
MFRFPNEEEIFERAQRETEALLDRRPFHDLLKTHE